jgi:hypothetical protein
VEVLTATTRRNTNAVLNDAPESSFAATSVVLVAAIFLTPYAYAEQDLSDETTELINQFSDCAGFYSFTSESMVVIHQPASAQQAKNLENGAKMSALYLLATDYAKKNKDPKPYGYFGPYVESRMDAKITTLRAHLEQKDSQAFKDETEICNALQELQEQIVQTVRNQMYR